MSPNSNFNDLLRAFNDSQAKYLIVGGYAVMLYTVMSVTGMKFEQAWPNRAEREFGAIKAYFIAREDLIKIKSALGRSVDLVDVERLTQSNQ